MFYKIVAPAGLVLFLTLCCLITYSFGWDDAKTSVWTMAWTTSSILYGYGALCLGMSVYTLLAIGLDKWIAVRNERRRESARGQVWRISEYSLHLLAMLGGWPGSWLGQRQFRHKTSKFSFRAIFWGIVWLHACTLSATLLVVNGFAWPATIAAAIGIGGVLSVAAVVRIKS